MLLAADIGNTNITLGIFEDDKLRASWRLFTDVDKMADEYAALLMNLLSHQGLAITDIKDAAVCSGVPPLVPVFQEVCRRYLGTSALVVGAGIKTGVRILYEDPRQVGPDRVVDAAAAFRLYGGPVIVVDFGTGTVFDAISKEGDYLGGAIAPGIRIAADALSQRTAVLPRIELVAPKQAIGRNTVSSMQSGIMFGYVGLIEGIVARFRKELGEPARVVATGGLAEVIAKEAPIIDIVDVNLTLVGLRLIHELNR